MLPLALVLAAGPALSTDPDGLFALRFAWDGPDHVRVTVQALGPVDEVVVTWVGPPGVALKAERAAGEKSPESVAGGERLALGRLEGRGGPSLRLRVEGDRGAGPGRVAVVKVEGLFRGRPVREAIGIPLGEAQGRLRGDVIEYDASVGPPR